MRGRLLVVLMMGAALGSLGQSAQDVTTVRAAVTKIEALARNVRKSQSSQGRRLQSMPDVDFGKMCTSNCWASITTSIIKMVVSMEKDCPATNTATDPECGEDTPGSPHPTPPPTEEEEEPGPCLFDMGSMSMGPGVGTLAEVCDKGVVKMLGSFLDACALSSFEFICGAVLGACATDNTEERKLLCPAPSANDEPEPHEERDCSSPPADSSGESMAASFNQMCAYNPTGKFYCQQKAAAWEKKGAFKEDPEVIFSNPCDVDCDKPTGKAIAEMGCCMGTLISTSEEHGQMSKKALASVKATVFKCGGMKAMQVCSGADSGILTPTTMLTGTHSVATCPATSSSEMKVKAAIAKTLSVKAGSLSLVSCVPAGSSCEDGDMASSAHTINYAVKVTGSTKDFAAKEQAVQARVAANNRFAKPGVASSCGSVSLSLGILILSFLASSAM